MKICSTSVINPFIQIPVVINIDAEPQMSFSTNCFNFDSIQNNSTTGYRLWVYNEGCETLEISDIASTDTTVSSVSSLIVYPFDSAFIDFTFSPKQNQLYSGNIIFTSNAGDSLVCFSGYAGAAPVYFCNDDSVVVNTICHDSVIYPLVIHNNGGTPNAQFDQGYLFLAYSGNLELAHSTVADNTLSTSDAMFLGVNNADLKVNNSIIQGDGQQVFEGFTSSGTNLDLTFKCNVMHEAASLGTSGDISDNTITASPGFIDGMAQDYRLSAGSVAIDKCDEYDTTQFTQVDFEGDATGVDDPYKLDVLGTYDAGADESYQWDIIFQDAFE